MIVRVSLPGDDTVHEYAFHRSEAIIGSSRRSDIRIPLSDVALRHARLQRRADRIWLQPLKPGMTLAIERSGVGRIKSASAIAMVPGDLILVGPEHEHARIELITVDIEAETGPARQTAFNLSDDAPPAPSELLEVVTRFAVESTCLTRQSDLCRALSDVVQTATGIPEVPTGIILLGGERQPLRLLPEQLEKLLGGQGALVTSTHWRRQLAGALSKEAVLEIRGRNGEHIVAVPLIVNDTLIGLWTFGTSSSMPLDTFPSIAKPVANLIINALDRLTQARELKSAQQETRYFRERERQHYLYKELVTESPTMQAVYSEVNRIVREASTVWILGEKGTGKEMIARAIHHLSDRSEALMISQNCASLDEERLDLELFGRSDSSTEGEGRPGLLELTRGGTLFLEEIGRLPLALQAKLSRAIQEREVRPRDSSIARPIDMCLIVSSEQDLFGLVDAGKFRRDLYLQLARQTIRLPPLRDRLEDIVPLANVFVATLGPRYRKSARSVDESVHACLQRYHWPGNVRELQGYIESAVIAASPDADTIRHIPGLCPEMNAETPGE